MLVTRRNEMIMRVFCLTCVCIAISVLPNALMAQSKNEKFVIVTSDIDNFWRAYDSLQLVKDRANQIRIINQLYLYPASSGFKEFISARNLTAEKYVQKITQNPTFWENIRIETLDLDDRINTINNTYNLFRQAYQNFYEPNVCFAIGCLLTNATISNDFNWMLFGTELIVSDSATNVLSKFKFIVAHEATHIQQIKNSGYEKKLLNHLLLEGGADFIAELVTGIPPHRKETYQYGKIHEKEVWNEMHDHLSEQNFDEWFGSSQRRDRPQRLGYFIGYEICKSYYQQAKDKQKAIQEIIEIENAELFLEKSGYESTLEGM